MLARKYELRSRISDWELIEGYLRPKVEGQAMAIPGFILELGEELYTREPWLLPQPTHPILNRREWFYLGKRIPKYLCAEGVYFEGSWIPMTGRVPIRSEETGETIGGTMRFRYCFKKKNDKDSVSVFSNWFMREYRLYDHKRGAMSKRVLCKITENEC